MFKITPITTTNSRWMRINTIYDFRIYPRSAHITTSLAGLHWLRVAERVKFKLATLTYRCLHCEPLRYLLAELTHVADTHSCRRLRLPATDALLVRLTRFVTVGDRAFPVAAAKL